MSDITKESASSRIPKRVGQAPPPEQAKARKVDISENAKSSSGTSDGHQQLCEGQASKQDARLSAREEGEEGSPRAAARRQRHARKGSPQAAAGDAWRAHIGLM